MANLFPAIMKFKHNLDGAWLGGNFQQKLGNIMVMRMAEVYLIAAEATLKGGGSGAAAAQYLNELRRRAVRNIADFNVGTGMQLTTATMNDVFDEYARELCGEYNSWAILKRNKAFENRLQTYNKTAFTNFLPAIHYKRPMPLSLIHISMCIRDRVYTTLTNPVIIARSHLINNYDPEMNGSLDYPLTKQFVAGLNVTF